MTRDALRRCAAFLPRWAHASEGLIKAEFSVVAWQRRRGFHDATNSARIHLDFGLTVPVFAPFEAVVRAQGALIPLAMVCKVMRRFFASTRLASLG